MPCTHMHAPVVHSYNHLILILLAHASLTSLFSGLHSSFTLAKLVTWVVHSLQSWSAAMEGDSGAVRGILVISAAP